MKRYLIAYDISDDRLRNRVVKLLKRYGFYRMQRSVFLGYTREPYITRIREKLASYAQQQENDSYLILPVEGDMLEKLECFGAISDEQIKLFTGQVKVLFF